MTLAVPVLMLVRFIKTSLETAIIYVAEENVATAQMLSNLRLKFGSHTRLSLSLK